MSLKEYNTYSKVYVSTVHTKTTPHLYKDELVLYEHFGQTIVLLDGFLGLRKSHEILILLEHLYWPRDPPIELSGPRYLARDWREITGNWRMLFILIIICFN